MPRAERLQKCAAKQLQCAAKASGQTSLAAFVLRPGNEPSSIGGAHGNHDEVDKLAATANNSASFHETAAVCVQSDPWVRSKDEFCEDEKVRSESKGRYCQADWFTDHEWMWYHREKRAVFCHVCTGYRQQHDNSPFIFSETDLTKKTGFRNWKKGAERLREHERSENHRNALNEARKTQRKIAPELDKQVNELQKQRREGPIAHLSTLKTILRQGIAVRGHSDEDSNIVQFNRDKATDNPALALFLTENNYMSHEILNEQEEILVLKARRRLINEINVREFYTIICDESSDISKIEQLSFSVRHCSDEYEIAEDFIGVMPCDGGLTSEALLKYVKDIMVRCGLEPCKLIGMAFDGASSMKHLATLLKTCVSKEALYIHCFAHCNELVFKDASSISSIISEAQDLCENVYVLAGVSPKRILLFQNVQKEMSASSDDMITNINSSQVTRKLKNLSRTRWTTRGSAADVVLQKYHALRETIMVLHTDRSVAPECRSRCKGMLEKLKSFSEMFKLVVLSELASLLENNSKKMQSASLTAEQALTSIDKMCIRLDTLRTKEEFERLITKVTALTGLTDTFISDYTTANNGQQEEEDEGSMPIKRKRKCPSKLTDFVIHSRTSIHTTSTLNEKAELMRQYFETLDVRKNAVMSRFDQDDLQVLKAIERFVVKAANKAYEETGDIVKDLNKLSDIIDLQELGKEAQELSVYIKLYNRKCAIPVRYVTQVSTVCEIMNNMSECKDCVPQIHKLLKYYVSVPMGSATAERTFSAMRRIKSWLRSTMSSNSLNNRMFSTIHKKYMDEVSILDVAKEFSEANDERRVYFGDFDK